MLSIELIAKKIGLFDYYPAKFREKIEDSEQKFFKKSGLFAKIAKLAVLPLLSLKLN